MKRKTKVIFIFGPMASGKYTIGSKIGKKTGYLFLHNHVFTEIASELVGGKKYSIHDKNFYGLLGRLKCMILENRAGIVPGMIFTGVYAPGSGDKYIKRLLTLKKEIPAEYYFIQLKCSFDVLLRRVGNSSRKKFDHYKVTSRKRLKEDAEKRAISAYLPVKALVVHTDKNTIKKSVEQIINYCKV